MRPRRRSSSTASTRRASTTPGSSPSADLLAPRILVLGHARRVGVDLLDDLVPLVRVDDALDRLVDVPGCDQEEGRLLADLLVVLDRRVDRVRARRVAAFADEGRRV